jgi:hemin uptake protein HemP
MIPRDQDIHSASTLLEPHPEYPVSKKGQLRSGVMIPRDQDIHSASTLLEPHPESPVSKKGQLWSGVMICLA